FLGALVVIVLLWQIHLQSREILMLTADITRANADNEDARATAMRQEQEISRLKESLNAIAHQSEGLALHHGDEKFENALDVWIGKVRMLSTYLENNPDKRIPQMDLLTEKEWLDVTKDIELDSEADFRQALGKLRGLARQKVASQIREALKGAMAAY